MQKSAHKKLLLQTGSKNPYSAKGKLLKDYSELMTFLYRENTEQMTFLFKNNVEQMAYL